MSAILFERLLYTRAGIVAPTRSYLSISPRTNFARYSTGSDRPSDSNDVRPKEVNEDSQLNAPKTESSSTLSSRAFDNDPSPPMRPLSDSPRIQRGVHRRDTRSKGQTPSEQARLDEAISEIYKSLQDTPFDQMRGGLDFLSNSPAFTGGKPGLEGDMTGYKDWSHSVRRRTDRLEDDRYTVELDEMKEEVTAISTDLELLDWARKRVFTTTTTTGDSDVAPTTTSPETPKPELGSGMEAADSLDFPKTYPKILAHVMEVARINYNNPHLSLAFFHHARTLSVESYLVGCLSSAYNELIKTRWECFRDFDGVDQAIKEMDANGISWDLKTTRVVGKVVEEVGGEVLRKGAEPWGGDRVYQMLERLERKVQKAIDKAEREDYKAKKRREKRLWDKGPARF